MSDLEWIANETHNGNKDQNQIFDFYYDTIDT